eukprot:14168569-Ditylum_brightwellii.AAC.1
MSTMWKKIRFTDRKRINSSITSLQIPSSWPGTIEDVSSVKEVENPNTAKEWRTVDTPQDIAFYLKLRNRLHF